MSEETHLASVRGVVTFLFWPTGAAYSSPYDGRLLTLVIVNTPGNSQHMIKKTDAANGF